LAEVLLMEWWNDHGYYGMMIYKAHYPIIILSNGPYISLYEHLKMMIWQCVKTLYPFCSHQNSWDLWMFIPHPKWYFHRYWSIAIWNDAPVLGDSEPLGAETGRKLSFGPSPCRPPSQNSWAWSAKIDGSWLIYIYTYIYMYVYIYMCVCDRHMMDIWWTYDGHMMDIWWIYIYI